ncbi:MAG: hypothetical protein RL220_1456, partial [Bacteroidota bacterium]
LASVLSFAQPGMNYSVNDKRAIKKFEEAVALYDQRQLTAAKKIFESLADSHPDFIEVKFMLASISSDEKDMPGAIRWLSAGLNQNERFFVEGWLTLAECEMSVANYEGAEKAAAKYIQLPDVSKKKEDKARQILSNCVFAKEAMQYPKEFNPKNLGTSINTPENEYYPCLTADGSTLLFTRQIKDPKAYTGKQEDFFISQKDNDQWSKSVPVMEINTPNNEGAPTLSPDGQVIIFTACEDVTGAWGGNRQGIGSCDLFYAYRRGNSWSDSQNLGGAVNSYGWESQPSFAADGRTLYFVRGRFKDGGIKEQDIYVAHLTEEGAWTKPEPIPGKVNTPYEEESVMIHPDGSTLFFSSNGHTGMGGLDIFMSRLQPDGTWGKPVNLGYPINTHKDENSLLVSADGELAFFASDRDGGQGGLDIYSFELYDAIRPTPVTYVNGIVKDAVTGKKLESRFQLTDLESGKMVAESYSNPLSGEFLVCIPAGKDYALSVSKEGYLFHSENFSLKNYNRIEPFKLDVNLQPIKAGATVVLNNIFFDSNSYTLLPTSHVELDALAKLLRANPSMNIEIGGHTDNVGSDTDNQVLSERRAAAVVQYLTGKGIEAARLQSKGYGETSPIDSNDTESGRARNRRTEFRIL